MERPWPGYYGSMAFTLELFPGKFPEVNFFQFLQNYLCVVNFWAFFESGLFKSHFPISDANFLKS